MIRDLQHWLDAQGDWGHQQLVRLDVLLERHPTPQDASRALIFEVCSQHDVWVVYRRQPSRWSPSEIVAHRCKLVMGMIGGFWVMTRCGVDVEGGQLVRVPCEPGHRPGIEIQMSDEDCALIRRTLHVANQRPRLCSKCYSLPRWNPHRKRAKTVAVGRDGSVWSLPSSQEIPAGTLVALGPDGRLVPAAAGAPAIGTVAPVDDPRVLDDGRVVTARID